MPFQYFDVAADDLSLHFFDKFVHLLSFGETAFLEVVPESAYHAHIANYHWDHLGSVPRVLPSQVGCQVLVSQFLFLLPFSNDRLPCACHLLYHQSPLGLQADDHVRSTILYFSVCWAISVHLHHYVISPQHPGFGLPSPLSVGTWDRETPRPQNRPHQQIEYPVMPLLHQTPFMEWALGEHMTDRFWDGSAGAASLRLPVLQNSHLQCKAPVL